MASCAVLGYIVLPLSQIRAEIGRQHSYPALLSSHPSSQLSVVAAMAVPVFPVLSNGDLVAGVLGGVFGKCCGACPQCHYIIGGSSRGDWTRQCSFSVLP